MDCTAEVELCREHQITGFPSIRVFRAGKCMHSQNHLPWYSNVCSRTPSHVANQTVPTLNVTHHVHLILAYSGHAWCCLRHAACTCEPDGCCGLAGHDEINVHGVKEHESYRGDRTQASLTTFADNLVPSAGQPHHYIRCSACSLVLIEALHW